MKTQTVALPSGLSVRTRDPRSLATLHHQVQEYFTPEVTRALGGTAPTVIDIGANIGLFTLEVLGRCAGAARVYCCEPIPDTYRVLEENVAQYPRARPLRVGIGRRRGRAVFRTWPECSARASMVAHVAHHERDATFAVLGDERIRQKHGAELPVYMYRLPRQFNQLLIDCHFWWMGLRAKSIPCELWTLSDLIAAFKLDRIDLVKIDVERAELDVLEGIEERDWEKIGAMVVEVHDFDGRAQRISQLLRAQGFRLESDRIAAHDVLFNLVASRA